MLWLTKNIKSVTFTSYLPLQFDMQVMLQTFVYMMDKEKVIHWGHQENVILNEMMK